MTQLEVPRRHRVRRLWGRWIGAAVVVASAMLGTAVGAAPAQAASGTMIHPEWVDGCPGCPGPIFIVQRELDQRTVVAVTGTLRSGLSNLIGAIHAQDPAVAKRLHATALGYLDKTASLSGFAGWGAVADGDDVELCPRWPWPWPWPGPPPWWDVERELADGITLLGQAATTKDPVLAAELRGKGIEQLDTGAAGLDAYQGCTG